MIRLEVQRSQFYSENTEDENKKYFDIVNQKFLHNVDTFYFNVFIKDDTNDNPLIDGLLEKLYSMKLLVKNSKDREVQEFRSGLYVTMKRYKIYEYCLTSNDRFDIFISDYLPNNSTPRIVVQLRSIALWIEGYDQLIKSVYNLLNDILNEYDLEILRTLENRGDYCYHTNAVQSPQKQFSDSKLEKELVTNLTIYQKIGNIQSKKYGTKLTLDYFALGQRKSNNVFVRCYNKTKEVIEEGYKALFFEIWHSNKMINYYDKYCLEFAYKKKSYEAIHEGSLLFYLEYGKDERIKREIKSILDDTETRLDDIKELSIQIMPPVTIIMNIEFQTKRKFYYYADKQLEILPVKDDTLPEPLKRVFKILDNRKLFLDYLTEHTLCFADSKGIVRWWQRLRGLKIDSLVTDQKFLRKYNKNLNYEKVLKRAINSIATMALYKGNKDSNFIEDFSDMLGSLNDNDMKHNQNLKLVSMDTGELLEEIYSNQLRSYKSYKEKKSKTL